MTQTLVIRPLSKDFYPLEWYTTGADLSEKHTLETPQQDALPAKENCCLLLSPALLIFRELTLPAGQKKNTQKLISWLAEETITAEGETFHWTVLSQQGNQIHVVGVEKDLLRRYLINGLDEGFNITTVKSAGYDLPWHEASWTVKKHGKTWLVRNAEYQLCELDDIWFRQLLASHAPENLYCNTPLPALPAETELHPLPEVTVSTDDNQDLASMNLLHGDFITKPMAKPTQAWIRKTALGCFIAAIAGVPLVKGIILWQLNAQANELRSTMQTRYQQFFPNDKRRSNFKFFFDQQVKHHRPDALTQLNHLYGYLAPLPDVHINTFEYRQHDGHLEMQITSDNPEQPAQLAESLSLTMSSVSQSEGSYLLSGEIN